MSISSYISSLSQGWAHIAELRQQQKSKMEAEINRLNARIELLERGASDQVSDSESDEDVERNSDSEYHPNESEDESSDSDSDYVRSESEEETDSDGEDEEEQPVRRVQHCSYCGEPEHKTTTCIHRWTVVLDNLRCPDHAIRAYVTRRDV
jgi:hypothetical protein